MKTLKLLLISLLLATVLSACNLPRIPDSPTRITVPNSAGTVAAMTLQVNPTQTQMAISTPSVPTPTVIASPISTPFPPNTPVWSIYSYTCVYIVGGGAMTMRLNWSDRSDNEDGYRVYRDKQVIATLAPNSTFYVDVAFVATGKTLSYFVEAFNTNWQAGSSTIAYGCQ